MTEETRKVRAARLDADGIYVGMDEFDDESGLTPLHLPQITECDRPPGKYKWLADAGNPFGGAFWPVEYLEKVERARSEAEAEASVKGEMTKRSRMNPGEHRRARTLAARLLAKIGRK